MAYRIDLDKEDFKFSAAHFTIFSASRAERLHGHNYQVRVQLTFSSIESSTEMATEFHALKHDVRQICTAWDEKVFLPRNSPHLLLKAETDGMWAHYAAKRYFFPSEDLQILQVSNITCEGLAREIYFSLKAKWEQLPQLSYFTVTLQETAGQAVTFGEIL